MAWCALEPRLCGAYSAIHSLELHHLNSSLDPLSTMLAQRGSVTSAASAAATRSVAPRVAAISAPVAPCNAMVLPRAPASTPAAPAAALRKVRAAAEPAACRCRASPPCATLPDGPLSSGCVRRRRWQPPRKCQTVLAAAPNPSPLHFRGSSLLPLLRPARPQRPAPAPRPPSRFGNAGRCHGLRGCYAWVVRPCAPCG